MRPRRQSGYLLLEAMLAVAIFAIGVITLGKSVNNCLLAERAKQEDGRARQALANRMAEIEAGAVALSDNATEDLKGSFAGMKMKQTRVALKKKNEKNQELIGLFGVTLEVSWDNNGTKESRDLQFYVSSTK
jgi:Tfp pilus assembly protein PilV